MMVGIDPAAVGDAAAGAVGAIVGVTITVALLVGTDGGGGATATGRAVVGGGRCVAVGVDVGVAVRVVVAGVATAGMGDDVTACGCIIGIAGS
jgi:hypothetical protein